MDDLGGITVTLYKTKRPFRGVVESFYRIGSPFPLDEDDLRDLRADGKLGYGQSWRRASEADLAPDERPRPGTVPDTSYEYFVVDFSDSTD